MPEVWYRWDGHSDYFLLQELPVLKHTRFGVWVDFYGKRKFCLNDSRQRFAYPTKEEAETSFIKRKEKQVAILTFSLQTAIEDLRVFRLPNHTENERPLNQWLNFSNDEEHEHD